MPYHSSTVFCLGLLCSLTSLTVAQTTTPRPVIAKVEIIFSMVSHYSHIPDRVNFYNLNGVPAGNTNYAVPHLVYEPSVTLYNPYNESLTMPRCRVRICDPPVGFAFKKNDVFLRSDFSNGNFHGLARFQIANETDPNTEKTFTLSLSSPKSDGTPGEPVVLQPGESKTFSAWVEKNWTWSFENSSIYIPRSVFDWNAGSNLTNRDNRTSNTFGFEAIANPLPLSVLNDPRAGFQTDCLSYYNGKRPNASRYSFESSDMGGSGWVAIKLDDTVTVQAKSMRTTTLHPFFKDFEVDMLKGQVQDAQSDIAREYFLSLDGITQDNQNPVITRTYRVGDLLQTPTNKTSGGKSPFARFSMVAKSGALRANRFYSSPALLPNDLYELQFGQLIDFNSAGPSVPSDALASATPVVHGVSRIGNTLFIDFSGSANKFGINPWKIRGSSSLDGGFNDNLDSATTVVTSMSASGIYKAIIDISGRGDRYFVRIEE
ncbi:hypothetical protein [Luteolibacter soli]|uniref:Uncharacterized protein n=1 Tax=Luteolibacter soli TaxID=3135280 RepID=A0ABU9AZL5_9BACT